MEQPGMTAQTAAADGADSWALPQSPVLPRLSMRHLSVRHIFAARRARGFALIGTLAYCAALIALIPAARVLPKSDLWQVGGTIWNGEAVLGGTTVVEWHWSALASLSHLAIAVNWHMTGGATDLVGTAAPGLHQLRLDHVSGVADGSLLGLAAPNLPVTCRFLAQVDLDTVIIGGNDQQALGNLRSSPVHCTAKALAAAALDLPALHGRIGPARGLSSGTGLSSGALFTLPSGQHLVEARLYNRGAFSLWPTSALTARVPALSGMRLDTTLHW